MVWGLSKLEDKEIEKIQQLEKELEIELLAFSDYDLKIADLNKKEINKIQELEKELNISLLAINE